MTSALQRLQANEDDTIWRQNESEIRKLYQQGRKTLKEVKAIMENVNGFPVTPLQTWEVKLRGLGMQKKLKARHWSLVYQHVRPRLQHEGKKTLRKPTAVLINNTEKRWDDVWKEFRRNRALSVAPRRDTLSKTALSPHTVTRSGESQHDRIISGIGTSDSLAITRQTTSWKSQLIEMVAQLLPGSGTAAPSGQDLGLNFDSHHYLSMVIYLLSNNHIRRASYSHEVTMSTILEMIFTLVSRRLLSAFLESRLPSIKAAWEKLLCGAQDLRNKEAFTFLISVGMEQDWLDEHDQGYIYLLSAVLMDCMDILHALLGRGCRPNPYFMGLPPRSITGEVPSNRSIFVEALKRGNLDCAKVLIQHCDVNHQVRGQLVKHKLTNFSIFIMNFDRTNPDHLDCLDLFLRQGADVDYEIDQDYVHYFDDTQWYWRSTMELDQDWPLSILDYLCYFDHPIFPKLVEHCGTPSQVSRAGLLWRLDQGVDALRKCLASCPDFPGHWEGAPGDATSKADSPERNNHYLEILVAEQFLFLLHSPDVLHVRRLQGLSKMEVDLTWLSQRKILAASMLHVTALLITFGKGQNKEQGLQILQWLLNQGFEVKADAIAAAAGASTGAVLDSLASFCNDFETEGGKALVLAVKDDNWAAIKRLLRRGVNINTINDEGKNVFEQAACTSPFDFIKYLVHKGAKPRPSAHEDHASCALIGMFQQCPPIHDLLDKVQYIIENHIAINEPSCPSAQILEMCISSYKGQLLLEQRRTVFEFLLKKGARLSPGSPLAVWIAAGGGHQLVQEMLVAGADPDAHSFGDEEKRTPLQAAAGIGDSTLVCMLMERGADVNGPALGCDGKTALQAVCAWEPLRREERLRKDKILQLLIDKGAEVNAAACNGRTALMYAAMAGDLSTALILLKHRAKLDVIAKVDMGIEYGEQTALDAAAWRGRLDMVKFLLNANALSSSAWCDGKDYDGAIEWARSCGNLVVSEVICKHAADRKRWDVPHGQAVARNITPTHTPQSLSLRASPGTAPQPLGETQFTPSEILQDIAVPDHPNGSSYVLDEGMVESGSAASIAKGKDMSEAEATDMNWTCVIEEIENESPLVDAGCQTSSGEKTGRGAYQTSGSREASSGSGGWSYGPANQDWVKNQEQNVVPLVSSSLTTDVFMGFSESPGL